MPDTPKPPDIPDESQDPPPPRPQPEPDRGDRGGSGSGGNPPRPTAVGTGGPDDPWENLIAQYRRYDLQDLTPSSIKPDDFVSWPIPDLTFIGINPSPRTPDLQAPLPPDSENPPSPPSSHHPSQRDYLMEDALTGLYGHKANIAFLVASEKTDAMIYMGIFVPELPENPDFAESPHDHKYGILKSIVHSAYNTADILPQPFDSEHLTSVISPLSNHIGLVTGIPSIGAPSMATTTGATPEAPPVYRIIDNMRGHQYGILVLAVPIPPKYVKDEETMLLDLKQRAVEQLPQNPEKKRRIKYCLELQEAYLDQVQLGDRIGMWQTLVYYFAPDRASFLQLESVLNATYTGELPRPTPLRTLELYGLQTHLHQFGLLRNQASYQSQFSLLTYKFLTPLHSQQLATYIHLPAG